MKRYLLLSLLAVTVSLQGKTMSEPSIEEAFEFAGYIPSEASKTAEMSMLSSEESEPYLKPLPQIPWGQSKFSKQLRDDLLESYKYTADSTNKRAEKYKKIAAEASEKLNMLSGDSKIEALKLIGQLNFQNGALVRIGHEFKAQYRMLQDLLKQIPTISEEKYVEILKKIQAGRERTQDRKLQIGEQIQSILTKLADLKLIS